MKKSCQLADWVAFILPLSFQKESMHNRVPLTHSLFYERVLEPLSFINPDGHECFISTVFQVWERRRREKPIKRKLNLHFVKTPSDADFAIRRVGMKAGEIVDDPSAATVVSHYFVKGDENLKKRIREIEWSRLSSRTVGPRSLSKNEISDALEKKA